MFFFFQLFDKSLLWLLTKHFLSLVPVTIVIDKEYSNLTLVTGDAIIFTCVPDSEAPFSIKWRKDGSVLSPQANNSLLLHIQSRNDSGRYECVATSKGREEVLAVDVVVFGE